TNSTRDLNLYKSYKDKLEYYLTHSMDNLLGEVGDVRISSPAQDDFLEKLFEKFKNQKLFLSRPSFSITSNYKLLFNKIFETYIGVKYLDQANKHVSIKKYLQQVFEEKNLLDKKVVQDFTIKPFKDLDNIIKINVDFGYKNGVWNYMQTIPKLTGPSKNTEWYAKTKFMFDNIDSDAKVHLLYRSSEINDKDGFYEVIDYFANMNRERIHKLDLDEHNKVIELCNVIERDAHDIDEFMIS
ncbi:hypothetical protein, partial [Sporosarcina koreensis]|uniref:hypothetical protein n=1 Tax=Sporosarcina koreensis TaxID=334735 RepID=UPI0019111069